MPYKRFTKDLIDSAISLNQSGKNLGEIAASFGVDPDRLSKLMRANGHAMIRHYRPSTNAKQFDKDALIADYLSGKSVLQLHKEYGIERNTVSDTLLRAGIQLRNGSEANFIRMSRMTEAERRDITKSANISVRGKKQASDLRTKITKGREIAKTHMGLGEELLTDLLTHSGFNCVQQSAFQRYNIDILVNDSVAVELTTNSAGSVFTTSRTVEKIKDLTNAGINVLFISFNIEQSLVKCLDDIISDINFLQSNPSSIGQYRVVRCALQNSSIIRNDKGQFAAIPSPIKANYIRKKGHI